MSTISDCALRARSQAVPAAGVNAMSNEAGPQQPAELHLGRVSTKKERRKGHNRSELALIHRFRGDGVRCKAKLIGVESVSSARGDLMCQDAMQHAKTMAAIGRHKNQHKQKICMSVSFSGIRIYDEKSGLIEYEHPVHKISFIARDVTDHRAFGYICGADGHHRFYAIKTANAAESIVLDLRDLFLLIFKLKKKESVEVKHQQQQQQQQQPQQHQEPQQQTEEGLSDKQGFDHHSFFGAITPPPDFTSLEEQSRDAFGAVPFNTFPSPDPITSFGTSPMSLGISPRQPEPSPLLLGDFSHQIASSPIPQSSSNVALMNALASMTLSPSPSPNLWPQQAQQHQQAYFPGSFSPEQSWKPIQGTLAPSIASSWTPAHSSANVLSPGLKPQPHNILPSVHGDMNMLSEEEKRRKANRDMFKNFQLAQPPTSGKGAPHEGGPLETTSERFSHYFADQIGIAQPSDDADDFEIAQLAAKVPTLTDSSSPDSQPAKQQVPEPQTLLLNPTASPVPIPAPRTKSQSFDTPVAIPAAQVNAFGNDWFTSQNS
uniref:disabled homolog 1 isoform X2 n=1 Tax=Myxine glutinosa TaxID=7769 RepID=UPI00358FE762